MLTKLKSIKTWIVIWAILLITYIVIFDCTNMVSIATILCAVPLAYIPCNVAQKKILEEKATHERDSQ